MPKLFVPPLKTQLTLSKDWVINLHKEYRNWSLAKALGADDKWLWHDTRQDGPMRVVVPQGTVLSIERYYIKQNLKTFDSITFRVLSSPSKLFLKKRFWVKLADANEIEFSGPLNSS